LNNATPEPTDQIFPKWRAQPDSALSFRSTRSLRPTKKPTLLTREIAAQSAAHKYSETRQNAPERKIITSISQQHTQGWVFS
jgi:hypothetical protein